MKRFLPIALLCVSTCAFGQTYYQNNAYTTTYLNGTRVVSVVQGVSVQVCTNVSGACVQQPVYSDAGFTEPITQPMATDGSGNFGFWVAPGTYSYRVLNAQGVQIQAYPFTVSGAGGGSPGGTDQAAQVNKTGIFGGDVNTLSVNLTNHDVKVANQLVMPTNAYTPKYFGAKEDEIDVADGNITAGSRILTTTTSTPFNCSTDVGKAIVIVGAGPLYPGVTNVYGAEIPTAFVSTIASCQSNKQVTLADAANNTVSNQWTAFGTDDTAALKSCENMTASPYNGTCTLNLGSRIMLSNASSVIEITGSNGGMTDGKATIVFAPQNISTLNDGMFFLSSALSAIKPISSAGLSKNATSFVATNSGDAAALTPGEWIEIQDTYTATSNAFYLDWAQVKSVSGTTVNLMVPLRMSFPNPATWNPDNAVLGFRTITNLADNYTFKDFTVIAPLVTDGNGNYTPFLTTSATRSTTINNVTVWEGSSSLESNFDSKMHLTNNFFMAGLGPEIAESVDGIYTGNLFAKTAAPFNQFQDACTANVGTASGGADIDIGTGFFTFGNNQIPESCGNGLDAIFGVHDGQIKSNNIGIVYGPSIENIGISIGGDYHIVVEGNTLSGATGSTSFGIVVGDDSLHSIQSDGNNVANNNVNQSAADYAGGDHLFNGALHTDKITYPAMNSNAQTDPYPRNMLASNTFGADGVLNQLTAGFPFAGIQHLFGDSGGEQDAVGSAYGSDGAFLSFNSKQTASGVDNWHQTSNTLLSSRLVQDNPNGLRFQYAAPGQADGNAAAFWTTYFQVAPNGNVVIPSLTAGNCVQAGTSGQLVTTSAPCSSGSGSTFITSLTTTGSSGPATVSGGVLNIPQYTGGGGSAVTNFIAPSGSWPSWLVPSVATSTTTPTLSVTASAIPYTALTSVSANTLLGALTATTPSGLAVPGCSGANSALTWVSGAGFGCNTISGGAVGSVSNSDGTLNISPTTGSVIASLNLANANVWTAQQSAPSFVAIGAANGYVGFTSTGSSPGSAPANTIQLEAPSAVTAYRLELPGAIPTSGNTYLSCTAASPSVCTWSASSGGTGTVTHTVGALTTGQVTLGNGTADIKADANLDDGITTASTLTYKGTGGLNVSGGGASFNGGITINGDLDGPSRIRNQYSGIAIQGGWGTTGTAQVIDTYNSGTIAGGADAICMSTSADQTATDCPAGAINVIGIMGSGAGNAPVIKTGVYPVNLDGTYSPVHGQYACVSPTTAGKATIQTARCSSSGQIGMVDTSSTSVTTASVDIYPAPPAGSGGGTTFTASGCSNSTLVGGPSAGSYDSGTSGTCTVVVTMGASMAAPHGWACRANDLTTNADVISQTATTATTATLAGTTVSGDVINFACTGY